MVTLGGEAIQPLAQMDAAFNDLLATSPQAVLLDLSGLTMISSQGLGLQLVLRRNLASAGVPVKIIAINQRILGYFRCIGLDVLFDIVRPGAAQCVQVN